MFCWEFNWMKYRWCRMSLIGLTGSFWCPEDIKMLIQKRIKSKEFYICLKFQTQNENTILSVYTTTKLEKKRLSTFIEKTCFEIMTWQIYKGETFSFYIIYFYFHWRIYLISAEISPTRLESLHSHMFILNWLNLPSFNCCNQAESGWTFWSAYSSELTHVKWK